MGFANVNARNALEFCKIAFAVLLIIVLSPPGQNDVAVKSADTDSMAGGMRGAKLVAAECNFEQ